MSASAQRPLDKMIFREADRHPGRRLWVSPANAASRHFSYARILLDGSVSSVSFGTGERKTGLVCLGGAGTVRATGDYEDFLTGFVLPNGKV